MTGRERRKLPRYPVNTPVRWRFKGAKSAGKSWRKAVLLNVGHGGSFLQTSQPITLGAPIEIELPFADKPLVLSACIQWISQGKPKDMDIRSLPKGFGLCFLPLAPEETKEKITAEILSGRWLQDEPAKKGKRKLEFFAGDIEGLL